MSSAVPESQKLISNNKVVPFMFNCLHVYPNHSLYTDTIPSPLSYQAVLTVIRKTEQCLKFLVLFALPSYSSGFDFWYSLIFFHAEALTLRSITQGKYFSLRQAGAGRRPCAFPSPLSLYIRTEPTEGL